jgi:predicted XRE-type DNA-binding protein
MSKHKIKERLRDAILKEAERRALTQNEAADALNTTQPRISDLHRGKMRKFSTGSLIEMCEEIGIEVEVTLKYV